MQTIPSETVCRRLLEGNAIENPSLVLVAADGSDVRINATRATYPASMIKVPLAVAACILKENGELRPLQRPVSAGQVTENDAPSQFVAGYRPQFAELIEALVARSDNTATNVMLDFIGRERATNLMHDLGCTRTNLRRYVSGSDPRLNDALSDGENEHPAIDAARLFGLLAQGIAGCEPVLAALQSQIWNAKLSAGLADGDTFAHKTGDTQTASHDGGILRLADGRRIIIVLYSTLASNDANDAKIAQFMRELRPHFADDETL